MSEGYIPYMYSANAKLNMGEGEDDILHLPETEIKNIVINYDYEGAFMPVILITYNLSKKLIDRMIKERHNSTIILDLKKYTVDSKDNTFKPIKKSTHIKDEYIYFLYEDIEYNKDIDYPKGSDVEDNADIYMEVTIGLLKLSLINNNKMTINDVYRNIAMTDIILLNTKHMPILIEPIENKKIYREILIPPVTSISKLIQFLNDNYTLYNSNFRYFLDYDKTYLLSDRGNLVECSTDEDINNIIINIDSPNIQSSNLQGVFRDDENEAYVIEIPSSNTRYYEDSKTDNLFNNIVCINSEGEKSELPVKLLNTKGSNKKDKLYRVLNNDTNKRIKEDIELDGVTLRLNTTNVDSSIFTINKKIYVNNYKDRKEYNGQFIISQKKELYIKSGDSFLQHVVLILKFLKPVTDESNTETQEETDTE